MSSGYSIIVDGLRMAWSPIRESRPTAEDLRRAEQTAQTYRDINPPRATVSIEWTLR